MLSFSACQVKLVKKEKAFGPEQPNNTCFHKKSYNNYPNLNTFYSQIILKNEVNHGEGD